MIENLNNTLEKRFGQLITGVDSNVDWRIWFYANGLPSWRFKNYLSHSIADDFDELTKTEDLKHQRQVLEYKLLHKRFEENGFSAILFKSCGYPTEFPYYLHGNLDSLIERKHLIDARAVLEDLHYVELKHIEEPEKFLYKKFEGGKPVSEIHLHSTIGWGVPFMLDDKFWEHPHRTSPENDFIHYPSATDSLLITVAHTFYEDKSFSVVNILRVGACLHEEIDWNYVQKTISKRGWADGFKEGLSWYVAILRKLFNYDIYVPKKYIAPVPWRNIPDTLINYPLNYSFIKGKVFYYRKILHDHIRPTKTRIWDVIATFLWGIELKLHLRFQKSFLVAFSGIDGSGKTTQVSFIEPALNNCEIKTKQIWFRCFCSPLARWLSCNKGNRSKKNSGKVSDNPVKNREIFSETIERVFATIELLYVYAIKVRWYLALNKVVLLDRNLLDMGVELDIRFSERAYTDSRLWRFVKWAAPCPNVHIFLRSDKNIVVNRQLDEPTIAIEKMIEGYYELLSQFETLEVNADISIPESSLIISHDILNAYFLDWNLISKRLLLATRRQMNPQLDKLNVYSIDKGLKAELDQIILRKTR